MMAVARSRSAELVLGAVLLIGLSVAACILPAQAQSFVSVAYRATGVVAPEAGVSTGVEERPPAVVAFYVNDDAAYTADRTVSLTLEVFGGSSRLQVQFANEGADWSAWQSLAAPLMWTLSDGDGPKEVRARVRDGSTGTTTPSVRDAITLSTQVPTVVGTGPGNGVTGANPDGRVYVFFSEAMDPASVSGASISLWRDSDGDGSLDPDVDSGERVDVLYDEPTRSATLVPATPLAPLTRYSLSVSGSVLSASAIPLGSDRVSTFLTGETSNVGPPIVLAFSPEPAATSVPVTSVISVTFDREMDPATFEVGVRLELGSTGEEVPARIVQDQTDPRQIYIRPEGLLDISTSYTIKVDASLTDYYGGTLSQDYSSTFTTSALGVDPHGYQSPTSGLCGICHAVHGAAGPTLFTAANETDLCFTCHDGTGAETDMQATFSLEGSGHLLEGGAGTHGDALTSTCSSCHNPHMNSESSPELYRASINGATVTGSNVSWCEACHNDTFDWTTAPYPYPLGAVDPSKPERAADGYPISGTFPGATAYNDTLTNGHNPTESTAVVWPDSGLPSGDCRNCHDGHRNASAHDALVAEYRPTPDAATVVGDRQTGRYAELCLTCHDADGPAQTDIKRAVTFDADKEGTPYTGGHRIRTAGGNLPVGAPLPCYDCHNPHGSAGNNGTQPNNDLLSDERWSDIDTSNTTGVVNFCLQCHLPWEYAADSGQPEQNTIPAGQATLIEGLDRRDPTNALSLPRGMSAHTKANLDTPGLSCYSCHSAEYGPPAADEGYNVHRPEQPGGCVDCHTEAREGWTLTRRPVVGEFAGAGHHVSGGDVTDEDCGVCHLERDREAGKFSATLHADGAIDLRGPDSGLALAPFSTLVRDTSSSVLETEALWVQDGLCLECHDFNGAASPDAQVSGGTAARPFSANSADAVDIRGALDPGNSFTHAVRAPGGTVTCFDCHVTTVGHGGANADAGRTDFSSIAGQRELCLTCHDASVYEGGVPGSRFGGHGVFAHTLSGGNPLSCRGCHAGAEDLGGLPESNGSPGSIHGGSFTWPGSSPTPYSRTGHFLYGGWLSGWVDGTCWAGPCHRNENGESQGVPY